MANIYADIAGDIANTLVPKFDRLYDRAERAKLAKELAAKKEQGKKMDAASKSLMDLIDVKGMHRDVLPEVSQRYAKTLKAMQDATMSNDPSAFNKARNEGYSLLQDINTVYRPASAVGFVADKIVADKTRIADDKDFTGLGQGFRSWNFNPRTTGFNIDANNGVFQIGDAVTNKDLGSDFRKTVLQNKGSFEESGQYTLPFSNRNVILSPNGAAKVDAISATIFQNPENYRTFLTQSYKQGLIDDATFDAFSSKDMQNYISDLVPDANGIFNSSTSDPNAAKFANALNKFVEANQVSISKTLKPRISGGSGSGAKFVDVTGLGESGNVFNMKIGESEYPVRLKGLFTIDRGYLGSASNFDISIPKIVDAQSGIIRNASGDERSKKYTDVTFYTAPSAVEDVLVNGRKISKGNFITDIEYNSLSAPDRAKFVDRAVMEGRYKTDPTTTNSPIETDYVPIDETVLKQMIRLIDPTKPNGQVQIDNLKNLMGFIPKVTVAPKATVSNTTAPKTTTPTKGSVSNRLNKAKENTDFQSLMDN
jgi:hypothetical protein